MDHNRRLGFSLIEFIVVIGIIVIFSGITLAQYAVIRSSGKINSQVNRLIDVLDLARKKALSGDEYISSADSACASGTSLYGYSITFSGGTAPNYTTYFLQRVCKDNSTSALTTTAVTSYDITAQNLGPTYSFIPPSGNPTITFLTLSKGLAGGIASYTITLKQSDPTPVQCVQVTVDQTGNISKGAAYTSGC